MRFVPALFLFAMSTVTDIEWSERQPMPRAQAGGATAYLDGELLSREAPPGIGDVKTWLSDVQIYNPASDAWKVGTEITRAHGIRSVCVLHRRLEIFGGSDGQTAHRDSWKLDPSKTAWVGPDRFPLMRFWVVPRVWINPSSCSAAVVTSPI